MAERAGEEPPWLSELDVDLVGRIPPDIRGSPTYRRHVRRLVQDGYNYWVACLLAARQTAQAWPRRDATDEEAAPEG